VILFEPGPPTPPLHRHHPSVKMLDRAIRVVERAAVDRYIHGPLGYRLQLLRKALAGKTLRAYIRTGKRPKQQRLDL
jgi:hypothetical protein